MHVMIALERTFGSRQKIQKNQILIQIKFNRDLSSRSRAIGLNQRAIDSSHTLILSQIA